MKASAIFIILLLLTRGFTCYADTFTVTSNADSGPGTLRWAIESASSNGEAVQDKILFNLPAATWAGRTINLSSALPKLSSNLIIDGSSQPGSVLGISDARVIISVSLNTSWPMFYAFDLENQRDIEVYGLYFRCYSNDYYFRGVGLFVNGSKNIRIGGAGKGNMFTGWLTAIGYPEGYPTIPMFECDSIFIRGNLIGLLEDGNTITYGLNPWMTQDANCRHGIVLRKALNIQIGGPGGERNIINYTGQGVILDRELSSPASNFYLIENNLIGSNADGTLCRTTAYTNYEAVSCNHLNNLVVKDNLIMGEQRIAGLAVGGCDSSVITGNKVNVDRYGKQTNSSLFQGMTIEFCNAGMIGGTDPDKMNTIAFTSNNGGIFLFMSYRVTISRNSTYCNSAWGGSITLFGWYNGEYVMKEPFVTINRVAGNTISGTALPNSLIELFFDDSCSGCEGKTYLTNLMADAAGNWQYTGPDADKLVATATTPEGSTSQFSFGQTNSSNAKIRSATCGQRNGSITGIELQSGTEFHWEDAQGNIVGYDTSLLNVGPGTYKMVITTNSAYCRSFTGPYYIGSVELPASVIPTITSASCGQANGKLFYDFGYYSPYEYTWQNAAGDSLSSYPEVTGLLPGDYYVKVWLKEDKGCVKTYGPFSVINQSGPSVDQSAVATNPATCSAANGSITGLVFSGTTGTVYIEWRNEQNEIVGHNIDLLNQPAGNYRLKLKDSGGCDTIVTNYISIASAGVIAIDEQNRTVTAAACTRDNGSISGLVITGGDAVTWRSIPSMDVVGSMTDISGLPAGDYQLTASSSVGCFARSSVIKVPETKMADLTPIKAWVIDGNCGADNAWLKLEGFSNEQALQSYYWMNSATGQQVGTGLLLPDLAAGTYEFVATDTNGCKGTIFKGTVKINPKPVVDVSNVSITNDNCNKGNGRIEGVIVTGLLGPTEYSWIKLPGAVAGNNINLGASGQGTYQLMIKDNLTCEFSAGPFAIRNVDVFVLPEYNDLIIARYSGAPLKVKNRMSGNYLLYADAACTQLLQQNTSGDFTTPVLTEDRTFYVKFETGTCSTPPVAVKITVIDKSMFAIPKAFTPNNDGLNDRLILQVLGYIEVDHFRIFNRNGEEVFSTKAIGQSWDGRWKGQLQPGGVYVWMAQGRDINGQVIKDSGTIVLIR